MRLGNDGMLKAGFAAAFAFPNKDAQTKAFATPQAQAVIISSLASITMVNMGALDEGLDLLFTQGQADPINSSPCSCPIPRSSSRTTCRS